MPSRKCSIFCQLTLEAKRFAFRLNFRAKFEREAEEFVSKYDLAGQGQKKRESESKIKLNLLKQKAQNLSRGKWGGMPLVLS